MNKQIKLILNFCVITYVLITILMTGCAFSAGNYETIKIESLAGVTNESTTEIQQAADATNYFFNHNTDLILKKQVTIILTPNRKTFITEITTRFNISEIEAERVAKGTDALSGNNLIVLDISKIPTVRQKTFLIAHELTHHYQRQIAGNQASQVMWLLEGMAETIGAQVVAEQGYFKLDQYQNNWHDGLQRTASKPNLRELETRVGWSQSISKYSSPITYKTAGLAVLILTKEFGQQKVLDYFLGIGRGLPPEISFENSFGITITDYENRFMNNFPMAS